MGAQVWLKWVVWLKFVESFPNIFPPSVKPVTLMGGVACCPPATESQTDVVVDKLAADSFGFLTPQYEKEQQQHEPVYSGEKQQQAGEARTELDKATQAQTCTSEGAETQVQASAEAVN